MGVERVEFRGFGLGKKAWPMALRDAEKETEAILPDLPKLKRKGSAQPFDLGSRKLALNSINAIKRKCFERTTNPCRYLRTVLAG